MFLHLFRKKGRSQTIDWKWSKCRIAGWNWMASNSLCFWKRSFLPNSLTISSLYIDWNNLQFIWNGQRIKLVQLVFFVDLKLNFHCLFNSKISGFDEIVKILIEKGSPINIRDTYGDTPLFVASWNGIISNPSMKSHLKWFEFWWNCCLGNKRIVEMLLQNGSNVTITNGDGNSPLHLASQQGKFENENRKI